MPNHFNCSIYTVFPSPKQKIAYPDVTLLSDSLSLARGEYLIFGPAHCVGCHSKKEDEAAVKNGEIVALAGGKFFDTPMGNIYIPNITPDFETGIGNLSNGEIARAMRYAVYHTGRVMVPGMPFTHMSECDVSCIISYLRAQPAIQNRVPETNYTFFGKSTHKIFTQTVQTNNAHPKES